MKQYFINGVEVSEVTFNQYQKQVTRQYFDNIELNGSLNDKDLLRLDEIKFDEVER